MGRSYQPAGVYRRTPSPRESLSRTASASNEPRVGGSVRDAYAAANSCSRRKAVFFLAPSSRRRLSLLLGTPISRLASSSEAARDPHSLFTRSRLQCSVDRTHVSVCRSPAILCRLRGQHPSGVILNSPSARLPARGAFAVSKYARVGLPIAGNHVPSPRPTPQRRHSERNGGIFSLRPVPRDGPPRSRRISLDFALAQVIPCFQFRLGGLLCSAVTLRGRGPRGLPLRSRP